MRLNPRWAIRLCFAIIAFSVGLFVFRLGDFKAMQGISNTQLAFLLLFSPIASMLTLSQAPKLSAYFGLVNLTRFGISLSAFSVLILSLNPPFLIVAMALTALGAASGAFEVGLNTIAHKIDRESGSIMSSCHGFWSIGFAVGGFLAGLLSEAKINFLTQELIFVPLIIAAIFFVAKPLPHPLTSNVDGGGHSWPSLEIIPLCMVPFAGLFIEGATADWNTIFLKSERGWSDIHIGTALGLFMSAMAISRLFGDYFRSRFPAKLLITISTILSCIGLLLYTIPHHQFLIMLGAILGGIGAGNVYPLAIMLANENRDEADASKITGSIALVSFTAFLVAPVMMGWISDFFSLQIAFLLILPLFLATFLWLKWAKV